MLYGHTNVPMAELLRHVQAMGDPARARVVEEYLARRGKHDAPGRALERVSCTWN